MLGLLMSRNVHNVAYFIHCMMLFATRNTICNTQSESILTYLLIITMLEKNNNNIEYNYNNNNNILSSSGSLPTRQVQMFDVAIPLVVELVLSAFYILPPSSSPASFVLVFLLI